MTIWTMLRDKTIKHPLNDIIVGIIVALISIPISMGYAQIAGLPAVYGLYGSLFPILIYGFITTSPQFVVGVDAMPAAMVGTLLVTFSITPESGEALSLVPVISLMVGIWFIIFAVVKAGRIVKFISSPVMGGFISGVGLTIILMQIPKLYGGSPATGEIAGLISNIYHELSLFHPLSFCLGFATIVILLISKKYMPKIPMQAILLVVGALLQILFRLDQYGVKLLPDVVSGLPSLKFPDISIIMNYNIFTLAVESLSIAAVIMAQTLLATSSYASKYNDNIKTTNELAAYSSMNIVAAFIGCCPINGSVSRSGIVDSFKGRSQLISVSAALSMALILLFGTPFLKYLPVPILTAIVIAALIGIVDYKMFIHLLKYSRTEAIVFGVSMIAVLLFGTINGVFIGCFLSFCEIAVRGVIPSTTFIGIIPGHEGFHSISRNKYAYPIKNTVIYRFNGNLFFANIDKFEQDVIKAILPETHVVIIDARGIGSIDITALERLITLIEKLTARDIRFYITEHDSSLNDIIRKMGGESLFEKGIIRRSIATALNDAGIKHPYELDNSDYNEYSEFIIPTEEHTESEWAYGNNHNSDK